MSIVSCYRNNNRYVCFTSDFRVVVLSRLVRGSLRAPRPPSRICKYPDILTDVWSPVQLANSIGVPCRIPLPCVVYTPSGPVEVNEKMCEELCFQYPPPRDKVCTPSWNVLRDLMGIVASAPGVGHVYKMSVFIGKKKAYPAPWGPTWENYVALTEMMQRGLLPNDFEGKIVEKYGAVDVYSIITRELHGRIHSYGFNLYANPDGSYEALAIFWTENDAVARRYATVFWDMHENYTRKVLDAVEKAKANASLRGRRGRSAWHPSIEEITRTILNPRPIERKRMIKYGVITERIKEIFDAIEKILNEEEVNECDYI